MRVLLPLFFLVFVMACTTPNQNTTNSSQLGELQHQFTISEAARAHFDQGLLLLHSFEYDDAREAFKKAIETDPNEVMAHWGLAMTHYKALWGLQNVEAGRSVMKRFGDTQEVRLAKINDPLEKDFWKGVEILFGDGELLERNQVYVNHMEKVYQKNPSNLEVAAFYSLGLMWAGYDDQEYLDRSSEVAASIVRENPTHPGALHYMIHANDNPEFAAVALQAADEYAKVAPDAAHALHMPSHIYVALGKWNEVVSSNDASYQASLKRVAQKGLSGSARGYHSMAWLHYGYLQQGNFEKAAELLDEMIGYHQESTASLSYLIMMQNQQRIEAGFWPADLELQEVKVSGARMSLQSKSQMHFIKSLLAFDQQDRETIQSQISSLGNILDAAKLLVTDEGVALCSAGPTRYAPNQEGLQKTQVVIHQMEALAAILDKDPEKTEQCFQQASAIELEAGYDAGPPFIAYPTFEQYGDWLLSQERYEDALEQFNVALKNRTNRTKALKGKVAALKALNRLEEADEVMNNIVSG